MGQGPGYKLFAAVKKEELGDLNIIAEDLGFMTDEVIELRERTVASQEWKFCSPSILTMKVMIALMAPNNSVMYTGTLCSCSSWIFSQWSKRIQLKLPCSLCQPERVWICPMLCFRTVFGFCQLHGDFYDTRLLELDGSARMNFPSTLGGNWSWRMTADQLFQLLSKNCLISRPSIVMKANLKRS